MTPADSKFSTGAVRSGAVAHLSFTSLPMVGLIALARTAGEGAAKYGRFNYLLGMPVHDLLDHVFAHLVNYCSGDRTEPHLAHAAWGLLAAIQSQVLDPDLSAPHTLGPGSTITDAMRDHLAKNAADLAERRKSGEFDGLGNWNIADLPEVRTLLAARELIQGANELAEARVADGLVDLQSRLHEALRAEGYRPRDPLPIPAEYVAADANADVAAKGVVEAKATEPYSMIVVGETHPSCGTCPGYLACGMLGCLSQEVSGNPHS